MDSNGYLSIGDYLVNPKRIGKGNFSTIYLGYHKFTKEKVAVKKLEVENIYKLKPHVKREIELHKKLKHSNIVSLYDIVFDNNNHTIYLIMEFCAGGDFNKFQKKRAIKEIHVQNYMIQLANGLRYLMENKIIHRDLKPQNILLTKDGILKISDFGLAKEYSNMNNKMKQTYCGSPMYMAPEILHYQKYDNKSDLWSVGIILYEMITGNPPYHVKNFYQLIKKIEGENIVLPGKYDLLVSNELKDLLYKLLQKEPKDRISWEDFFNHKWLEKNLLLQRENKLMEISMTSSLPSLTKYKNDVKIFDSLLSSQKQNVSNPKTSFDFSSDNYDQTQQTQQTQQIKPIDNYDRYLEDEIISDDELFKSAYSDANVVEKLNDSSFYDENNDIIDENTDGNNDGNNNTQKNYDFDIDESNNTEDSFTFNLSISKKNQTIHNNVCISTRLKSSYELTEAIREAMKESSNPIDIPISKNNRHYNHHIHHTKYNQTSSNFHYDLISPSQIEQVSPQNDNIIYKKKKMQEKRNNYGFRNMFASSINILKDSYDYLSSHNKSI